MQSVTPQTPFRSQSVAGQEEGCPGLFRLIPDTGSIAPSMCWSQPSTPFLLGVYLLQPTMEAEARIRGQAGIMKDMLVPGSSSGAALRGWQHP